MFITVMGGFYASIEKARLITDPELDFIKNYGVGYVMEQSFMTSEGRKEAWKKYNAEIERHSIMDISDRVQVSDFVPRDYGREPGFIYICQSIAVLRSFPNSHSCFMRLRFKDGDIADLAVHLRQLGYSLEPDNSLANAINTDIDILIAQPHPSKSGELLIPSYGLASYLDYVKYKGFETNGQDNQPGPNGDPYIQPSSGL